MIWRKEQMQQETREQMRGGKGSVTVRHLMSREPVNGEGMPPNARLFAMLTLPPGASIGEHTHEGEAELFYFLSGEGVVNDDGIGRMVSAGDSAVTMSGHSHSVENTGSEDLVILAAIVQG